MPVVTRIFLDHVDVDPPDGVNTGSVVQRHIGRDHAAALDFLRVRVEHRHWVCIVDIVKGAIRPRLAPIQRGRFLTGLSS